MTPTLKPYPIENATVPFFTYTQEGIEYIEFDTST